MQFIISADGRFAVKAEQVNHLVVFGVRTASVVCRLKDDDRHLDQRQLTHDIPEAEARVILEEIITRLAAGDKVVKVADLVDEYCESVGTGIIDDNRR